MTLLCRLGFLSIFLVLFIQSEICAQTSFDISALTGTSKVQRSQKRTWEKLAMGNKLFDNDIVETFFQARTVLQFGKGNVLVLGSNSKLLVNIVEKTVANEKILDVSITLFAGGVYANVISGAHISIYTSNGVAETRKGAVSTVVEEKSGETGFQVLDGEVSVRNIAQQEGRKLTPGQTTMIFPGKQPTAPLFITYKHVAVLKHFFGDEYITAQLSAAGIKPTEDASAIRSRIAVSDNLFSKNASKKQDEGFQKYPFSPNRVYGAILEDHLKELATYDRSAPADSLFETTASVGARYCMSLNGAGGFPGVALTASYRLAMLDAHIQLLAGKNYKSFGLSQFASISGGLSLIDRLTLNVPGASAADTFVFRLGAISDLTIGDGTVVNRFTNYNPYLSYPATGFTALAKTNGLVAQFFLADVTRFSVGGLHASYSADVYRAGIGFFFDGNQLESAIRNDDYHFVAIPKPADSLIVAQKVIELEVGMDILSLDEITLTLLGTLARSAFKPVTGTVWRLPALSVAYKGVEFGAGFINESGQLAYAHMHSFYMSNRLRVDSTGTRFTTQNLMLSRKRMSTGYDVFLRFNPFKGSSFDATFRQEIRVDSVYAGKEADSSLNVPGISFTLAFMLNKKAIPALSFARLYLNQEHTSLYPPKGALFSSWGFRAGLDLTTMPLFANISLSAGVQFGMLDVSDGAGNLNFNNRVDAGDISTSFYISGMWGFL